MRNIQISGLANMPKKSLNSDRGSQLKVRIRAVGWEHIKIFELPGDQPLRLLLPVILQKGKLNYNQSSVWLKHIETGQFLSDNLTLSQFGVNEEDLLEIVNLEDHNKNTHKAPPAPDNKSINKQRGLTRNQDADNFIAQLDTRQIVGILLSWMFLLLLGGAIGESLVGWIGVRLFGMMGWVVLKMFFGSSIITAQFLSLRHHIQIPHHFIFFGAFSGFAAALITILLGDLSWSTFGLLLGLTLGIAESLIVRQISLKFVWIIVSAVAGAIAGSAAPLFAFRLLGDIDPITVEYAITAGAIYGLVFAVITAIPLAVFIKTGALSRNSDSFWT